VSSTCGYGKPLAARERSSWACLSVAVDAARDAVFVSHRLRWTMAIRWQRKRKPGVHQIRPRSLGQRAMCLSGFFFCRLAGRRPLRRRRIVIARIFGRPTGKKWGRVEVQGTHGAFRPKTPGLPPKRERPCHRWAKPEEKHLKSSGPTPCPIIIKLDVGPVSTFPALRRGRKSSWDSSKAEATSSI